MNYQKIILILVPMLILVALPFAFQYNENTVDIQENSAYALGEPGDGGCGGCGGDDGPGDGPEGGNDAPPPTPPAPAPVLKPTCTLSVSPASIVGSGNVNVTWTTKGANDFNIRRIENGGTNQIVLGGKASGKNNTVSGDTKPVAVSKSSTFQLKAWNTAGDVQCDDTVTVTTPPAPTPAPTCDAFTIAPVKSTYTAGDQVTFSWKTSNADTVVVYFNDQKNTITGSQRQSGSITRALNKTSVFGVDIANAAGTIHCERKWVTITTPPAPTPAPKCLGTTLSPNKTQFNYGEKVTFTWKSENADTAVIWFDGVSTVVNPNSSVTKTITKDTTFGLDIRNGSGDAAQVVHCPRTFITVPPPPPTPAAPVCISTTVSPAKSVYKVGDQVTFSWKASNANDVVVFFNNERNVITASNKLNSSITRTVTKDTTFGLDIRNGSGDAAQVVHCPREFLVVKPAPACELTVSPQTLGATGGNVQVTWETTNANDFNIRRIVNGGDNQIVLGGKASGKNNTVSGDTKPVLVTKSSTFQLTAWNEVGDVQCTKNVIVPGTPPVVDIVPTCDSFEADDDTLIRGETTQLRWQTTNAVQVTIDQDIGVKPVDSATAVSPDEPTIYTLTARSADGIERTCTEVIYVDEPPVVDTTPSCDAFTVNGKTAETVVRGTAVTLAWQTTNATRVAINNGVGTNLNPNDSINVTPLTHTTYTATVFDADGDQVICPVRVVTVQEPVVYSCESEVDFTVTPGRIDRGQSATLAWTTTNNVANLSINNGITSTALDNTGVTVSPNNTTTYSMSVNFIDGTNDVCPVTLTVDTPTSDPAPVCNSFVGTPDSFDNGTGGEVTFFWTTSNADTVTIDNGIGAVPVDGSTTTVVSGLGSKTFTLTATKGSRSDTCTEVITVTKPQLTCDANVNFTANPTSIQKGNSSTLNWTTTGVATVSLDNGITSTKLSDSVSVSPTSNTTYNLTATDAAGDSVVCPVTVTVSDEPVPLSCENNVNFSASPSSIDEGDNTVLTWSTSEVTSLSFNQGITDTALSGNVTVSPNSDTTYTMAAVFSDGVTRNCPVTVQVDEDNGGGGGGGGGSSSPRCELEISKTKIDFGEQIRLTWDTRNTSNIELTDDDGNVIVTTEDLLSRDKDDLLDGEITLTPDRDTEYTLEATRGSKKRTCKVEVSVDDDVSFFEVRDQQPIVAGISLTQVPYTGFEAGPALTFAFYALLTLWALFVAYVLVVKNNSILGFSLARSYSTPYAEASVAAANPETKQSAAEAYVAQATAAPVQTVPANLPTIATTGAMVGYAAAHVETSAKDEAIMTELENLAHSHRVLISGDAMRYFIAQCKFEADRNAFLERVITVARASYPAEDGWVVLNLERMKTMCIAGKPVATVVETATVEAPVNLPNEVSGAGSLAESIATGNIVAAYQMIGNRPMIALADAAADLDAVYRNRKGSDAAVSNLLKTATTSHTDGQIQSAIAALTGALDGVYTSEEEAVKMAIMKAVKALS